MAKRQCKKIKLTDEQKNVIKNLGMVNIIEAPGGCGKTEILARIVVRNLKKEEGIRIAVISWTNRAADNMEERLECFKIYRENRNRVKIGTFHRLAYNIIKRHYTKLGFTSKPYVFPGYDQVLINRLFKEIKDQQPNHVNDRLKSRISLVYNQHLIRNRSLKRLVKSMGCDERLKIQIYKGLKLLGPMKRSENLIDFNDMPLYLHHLLNNKKIAKEIVNIYPLIIQDEFQDSSDIQWEALKILIDNGVHFVGAGDPYQTIFRFSGASFDRFNMVVEQYNCKRFKLTHNHRLPGSIIELSNGLRKQIDKSYHEIISENEKGPIPKIVFNQSEWHLDRALVQRIGDLIRKRGTSLNNIVILTRQNKTLNRLSKLFKLEKIPHKLLSKRDNLPKELQFLLSFIRIALDEGIKDDWLLVLPYINYVSVKKVEKICNLLEEKKFNKSNLEGFSDTRGHSGIKELYKILSIIESLEKRPIDATIAILNYCDQQRKLKFLGENNQQRVMLFDIAEKSRSLEDFKWKISDNSHGIYSPFEHQYTDEEYLTLANIHQIKGKEFEYVFLIDSPKWRYKGDDRHRIDELMILDTAITRTKKYLYFFTQLNENDWKNQTNKYRASMLIRNCGLKLFKPITIGLE